MTNVVGIAETAHEALDLEVGAEVGGRDGQAVDERHDDSLVHGTRESVHLSDTVGGEGRVAGEQLVAAVAAERHRYVLASEPREHVSREHRGSANGSSRKSATSGSTSRST